MTFANQIYQEKPYVRNVPRKTRIGNPFLSKEKIKKSPRLKLKSKLKFFIIISLLKNSFQNSGKDNNEITAKDIWDREVIILNNHHGAS